MLFNNKCLSTYWLLFMTPICGNYRHFNFAKLFSPPLLPPSTFNEKILFTSRSAKYAKWNLFHHEQLTNFFFFSLIYVKREEKVFYDREKWEIFQAFLFSIGEKKKEMFSKEGSMYFLRIYVHDSFFFCKAGRREKQRV